MARTHTHTHTLVFVYFSKETPQFCRRSEGNGFLARMLTRRSRVAYIQLLFYIRTVSFLCSSNDRPNDLLHIE